MPKDTAYRSIVADAHGRYPYSTEDDAVWNILFTRQMEALRGVMAPVFFDGVARLGLTANRTPQVVDIDKRLSKLSRAGVEGVPAIIPPSQFYALLADRKFPVATFLRHREEIDYIEEPDLFHEVFGHCPLLTDPTYADVLEGFGKAAVSLGKGYSWHLFRLFWFTIEFGMIRTPDGLRGYGAGIASSPAEADHAMSDASQKADFDLIEVLRTPYRIDIVQPKYFVIDSFDDLARIMAGDLRSAIDHAKTMGDVPPLFETVRAG